MNCILAGFCLNLLNLGQAKYIRMSVDIFQILKIDTIIRSERNFLIGVKTVFLSKHSMRQKGENNKTNIS